MSGKVYAVASGKGGVGKTTTVVNLGVTLRADDHSVALVDADLGMANLGTFLGIDHEPTLHDVLAGDASIDDAMTEQAERFAILPGSRDLRQYATADPRGLESVLEELSERYEYVLVDTGAGVGFEDVLPLELVDEVILVTSPDRAALGDTQKTTEISELLGVSVRGVVVTMTEEHDDITAIEDRMGVELLATVPEDSSVPQSAAVARPLEAFAPESAAAEGYRELAATLTGRAVEHYEPTEVREETAQESDDRDEPSGSENDAGAEPSETEVEPAPDAVTTTSDDELVEEDPVREDTVEGAQDERDSDTDSAGADSSDDGEALEDESTAAADEAIEEEPRSDEETDEEVEDDVAADEAEEPQRDGEESADEDGKSGGLLSRLGRLFG